MNFWCIFGKPKDTDDLEVLEDYSSQKYPCSWYYKENAFESEEKRLMKILAATDQHNDVTMQLSLEDSALIERWVANPKNKG